MTKEEAIKMAQEIVAKYPQAKTANEAMDLCRKDNLFQNEIEMLIVWGRLSRLLPRNLGA